MEQVSKGEQEELPDAQCSSSWHKSTSSDPVVTSRMRNKKQADAFDCQAHIFLCILMQCGLDPSCP